MSDTSGGDWPTYDPADQPAPAEEAPSGFHDDALVGHVGVVVLAVPGGAGPGEVRIQHRGIHEIFLAFADEPIDDGVEVRVTTVRGPRQVGITPTTA
ncbi:hypothetical protein [Nocardioides montaniterrae]